MARPPKLLLQTTIPALASQADADLKQSVPASDPAAIG